jgi:ethanolamine ammonia-lyase small subunit
MAKTLENQLKKFIAAQHDRELNFSHYSHARLGLGHTGGHLKHSAWLDFEADFAQAKDAVFSQFDSHSYMNLCNELKLTYLTIHSQAKDVTQFLLRPDLGRLLDNKSENLLNNFITQQPEYLNRNILIVISGGLSPIALEHQIPGFLPLLIHAIHQHKWSLAPIILNAKGRVALGDAVNHYFKAEITIMLIGERPGLSTPDSMGIYFTYDAKPGCTDQKRNCISNIHARGLSWEEAILKLTHLINQSMKRRLSGIELKDE